VRMMNATINTQKYALVPSFTNDFSRKMQTSSNPPSLPPSFRTWLPKISCAYHKPTNREKACLALAEGKTFRMPESG